MIPSVHESSQVVCSRCKTPLPESLFNRSGLSPCPSCGTATRVLTFPVFGRGAAPGARAESVVMEGEASCFFHPTKKAVVPCGNCGRFICALCDLELNGEHLCPNCLESGKQKGKLAQIDNQRTIHASAALATALVSCLLGPVALITAPITLYTVFRHRKTPGSLVGGSGKKRRIAAAVLAVLQLVGWIVWIIALWL